jgi:hypothetical protein
MDTPKQKNHATWAALACLGLLAGVAGFVGCTQGPGSNVDPPGNISVPGASQEYVATKENAELLTTTSGNGKLVVAVDFYGTRALLKSIPVEERKQYILDQALQVYMTHCAQKHKGFSQIRIYALGIRERDEYAKGSFKNMIELAVIDSTPELLGDSARAPLDRAGNLQWKSGL